MDERTHHNIMENIFNLLLQDSSENHGTEIYTMLLNKALLMQHDIHLERKPYECSSSEDGYCNGFK